MSTPKSTNSDTRVNCDICAKLVPASEATVAEAVDYFVHFCGLECYDLWQKKIRQDQAKLAKQGHQPKTKGA